MNSNRNTSRFVAAAALAFAVLGGVACTTPCMRVQEILCECQGLTQDEQQACIQIAEAQERIDPPTAPEQEVCESLIPTCEAQVKLGCETLKTVEGKQACGLAQR